MDVRFSEEQKLLRSSARDFLSAECPISFVREMMEDERGCTDAFWLSIVALGWTGLTIDERFGGSSLGPLDLAILMEETGRALMPGPLFSSLVLGAAVIAQAGSDEQKQRWMPEIAAGRLTVAVARLEEGVDWGPAGLGARIVAAGHDFSLSASKLFVIDGHSAGLFVVPARGETGVSLALVPADAPGVEVAATDYTDLTRRVASVRFTDTPVSSQCLLGGGEDAWPALVRAEDLARVALAAEMCGGAEKALELSVEYAKAREQFGRPIGSFQALQHQLADMLVMVESARSALYYAAWSVANDSGARSHAAACMAKAYCSEAFARVSGRSIQIYGGMGFTWEADPQIYYKRAKACESLLGSDPWNREEAAAVLIDGVGEWGV